MKKFTSVLIANRGEIACRIIRSAKAEGYRTVAIYSDADSEAPHVKMADEAIHIGASPVNASYLVQEKVLAAAMASGAQAIHPGYGFLSENAEFAKACETAGLVFIGPSAEAIHLMGNKAEAKRRMTKAAVPCIPGYSGQDQSDATLLEEGTKIALPLMVKAAAGGGGRGMRLVQDANDLSNAIKLARAEATAAFGNGALILEKALTRPRHVEVQIFGDSHGNIVHLAERDCSVQRRHQKVIEEAPCPVMNATLREAMGAAAVAAARSIHYSGAGTVEFLLDENGAFYFLEMNTRLQVEHPVTELITAKDLVALQLRVAQGDPLGFNQEEVVLRGHAIEARLYTEDTAQGFLPTAGPVDLWSPATGPGIRIDSGISTGQEISPFYDSMVAKIIAYGPSRDIARMRLIGALQNTVLFGTTCNRDFLIACLSKDTFANGKATTAFIAEEFSVAQLQHVQPSFADNAVAAVLELTLEHRALLSTSIMVAPQLRNWSSASPLISRKQYMHHHVLHDLWITALGQDCYQVTDGDNTINIRMLSTTHDTATIHINDTPHSVRFQRPEPGKLYLAIGGRTAVYRDKIQLDGAQTEAGGSGRIVAPMHGLLLEVQVNTGDKVTEGDTLAVLEAMKMHYEIVANATGTVSNVIGVAGTQVAADALLIEISPTD